MQLIDATANPRALRAAFSRFATGVTVVTVAGADGPLGITANSFTSVSLDPPLLLWCPACASLRHDTMVAAPHFALHVLADDQQDVARAFSRSGDAFDTGQWAPGPKGLTLLDGCAARFVCRTENRLPAGDHSLVLGRILQTEYGHKGGLVFSHGDYGHFTPDT